MPEHRLPLDPLLSELALEARAIGLTPDDEAHTPLEFFALSVLEALYARGLLDREWQEIGCYARRSSELN